MLHIIDIYITYVKYIYTYVCICIYMYPSYLTQLWEKKKKTPFSIGKKRQIVHKWTIVHSYVKIAQV